jgi:fimbrial chaperone protein
MWKVSPCLLAAVALLHPGEAAASTYTVNPTRVYLNASTGSALVTLKNESAEPLRMQVKAQRWAQSLDGEIQLSATEDLIVFPALLTLKPGEERKIRVATSVAFGPVEKTYRLYVEELPPTTTEKVDGASVRILTRMGVPVFLQPAKPQAAALIRDLGLSNGRLTFQLVNTGNSHFLPSLVTVRGFAANGTTVGDWSINGWYVLAGTARAFALPLDRPACEHVRSLLVEVSVGETVLKSPLTTPGGACAN